MARHNGAACRAILQTCRHLIASEVPTMHIDRGCMSNKQFGQAGFGRVGCIEVEGI
jgi:hypothetical protein